MLNESAQWFPAQGKARGVVVVTHGLNLHPERMDEMAAKFAKAGFGALRAAFTGHSGDGDRHLQIRAHDWQEDASRIHSLAQGKAKKLGVPLYLVAYSFSALVFQVLSAELPFAKRVYFAPALATRAWYPIGIKLARLIPDLQFRSWIPDGYAANEVSGLRCVLALDDFFHRWKQGEGREDIAPALIWGDPQDELVNMPAVKKLSEEKRNWSFRELSANGCERRRKYHHLVIDSASIGKSEWERVMGETLRFLG
ncbi:MAG TPA: alpha/beta hydrolase [Bdellovibrionota bacterium]|jgi:esterase/lipase